MVSGNLTWKVCSRARFHRGDSSMEEGLINDNKECARCLTEECYRNFSTGDPFPPAAFPAVRWVPLMLQ